MLGTLLLAVLALAACSGEDGGASRASEPAGDAQTVPDEDPIPKPRPKLAEPEAGVVPGAEQFVAEVEANQEAGGVGASRLSDEEVREQLEKLEKFYASLPDPEAFDDELLPPEAVRLLRGWRVSVASVYYDYNKPIACGRNAVLKRDQLGVAHKTLPCGTQVIFRYGKRAIQVPVIDRGPYIKGRTWDLTGAAAIALRFNGLDEIEWRFP